MDIYKWIYTKKIERIKKERGNRMFTINEYQLVKNDLSKFSLKLLFYKFFN